MVHYEDITINPDNYNTHPERQIRHLIRSMAEFGFTMPLLLNEDLQLVAGEGRYIARCRMIKGDYDSSQIDTSKHEITELIPCIVKEWDEGVQAAYMIADNEIARGSKVNPEKLVSQIEKIISETDINNEAFGISDGEFMKILEGVEDIKVDNKEPVSTQVVRSHERKAATKKRVEKIDPYCEPGERWKVGGVEIVVGGNLELSDAVIRYAMKLNQSVAQLANGRKYD